MSIVTRERPAVGDPVLTVWQPWASLLAYGIKPVENRTYPPPSRLGSLRIILPSGRFRPFRMWIHAGKRWDSDAAAWLMGDRLHGDEAAQMIVLESADKAMRGAVIGHVTLYEFHNARSRECRDRTRVPLADDGGDLGRCSLWAETPPVGGPHVYHWWTADPMRLTTPIRARGRQRLWRWTP